MDTYDSYVWEPSLVKINALTAATEAACLVLSIDETVTNPKSEAANMAPGAWTLSTLTVLLSHSAGAGLAWQLSLPMAFSGLNVKLRPKRHTHQGVHECTSVCGCSCKSSVRQALLSVDTPLQACRALLAGEWAGAAAGAAEAAAAGCGDD